jgi:hypothetical protein
MQSDLILTKVLPTVHTREDEANGAVSEGQHVAPCWLGPQASALVSDARGICRKSSAPITQGNEIEFRGLEDPRL